MKIRTDAVSIVNIVVVQITRRIDIELVRIIVVEVVRRARPKKRKADQQRPKINGPFLDQTKNKFNHKLV